MTAAALRVAPGFKGEMGQEGAEAVRRVRPSVSTLGWMDVIADEAWVLEALLEGAPAAPMARARWVCFLPLR